jgi:hypothetical protein
LAVITATVAISQYVDSTVRLFDLATPYQAANNVAPGETITVTWTITPLVTGSGIPLRVSAESGDFFDVIEQPLVVNEPGTLPNLSLNGPCGLGAVSPGQALTLTASVMDANLQPLSDPATQLTATVYATPTLGYSTTLNLAYCVACNAYQGIVNLPSTAPTGNYQVDMIATHSGYDPATAQTVFFVTPSLSLTLTTNRDVLDVQDVLTLTARVFDRDTPIAQSSLWAEIVAPGGVITAPFTVGASGDYTLTVRPADLAPNLNGQAQPGTWQITVRANYMGGAGTTDTSVNVLDVSVLSNLTISKSGGNAVLTWPHLGAGVAHYEVYRSTNPYFAPGGPDSTRLLPDVPPPGTGNEVSYTDAGAFSPPMTDYFYAILAVDTGGRSYVGQKRVGTFNFALMPGGD